MHTHQLVISWVHYFLVQHSAVRFILSLIVLILLSCSHPSPLFSSLPSFFFFSVFVFPFLTLIMELTSVCSSLSCSLPSYVAGMHGNDWPMAFYLSGGLISCMGLIVCCILPNKPEDVGLPSLAEEERR